MMKHIACIAVGLTAGWALLGCSQAHPSPLTAGAAKKHIKRNVTTQAEVVEIFGTPNIITMRDGYEMWVYDKVSSRQTRSAFGAAGGGGGWGGSGAGGLGGGVGSSTRSETTVMLIIYFGEGDVVSDYKITQTKF